MDGFVWGKPVDPDDGWTASSGESVMTYLTRRPAVEHLAVYRPEAFQAVYMDTVGYPGWVGEFVPDGWY
jgi:hypothetical protein